MGASVSLGCFLTVRLEDGLRTDGDAGVLARVREGGQRGGRVGAADARDGLLNTAGVAAANALEVGWVGLRTGRC